MRWTARQLATLRRIYPDLDNEVIAKRLGRSYSSIMNTAVKLRLRKSAEFMRSPTCRFQRGHVTWNAGLKGWQAGGRAKDTQFKRGAVPANRQEVGSLRLNADGYVDMKIRAGLRSWRAFHVVLWEDANGPLPKGHVLRFRDGDHFNIGLENLELLSRRENMLRNSAHNLPKSLAEVIQLRGAINRYINRAVQGAMP